MVVDTSAIASILFGEPDAERLRFAIAAASTRLLSTANFVESVLVVDGRKAAPERRLIQRFVADAAIDLVPVTVDQANLACDAFHRFGKGRHPAGLNLGDCFAYALARATGEPLLFKGDDFARTDVVSALD